MSLSQAIDELVRSLNLFFAISCSLRHIIVLILFLLTQLKCFLYSVAEEPPI